MLDLRGIQAPGLIAEGRRPELARAGARRRSLARSDRHAAGSGEGPGGLPCLQGLEVTPASQRTLAQAAPAIREQLTEQSRIRADDRFNDDLERAWLPRTTCCAGFVMEKCSNFKRPSATDRP